jgi:amino acid adenylation domain-containing protein
MADKRRTNGGSMSVLRPVLDDTGTTTAQRKLLTHHELFPSDASHNLAFAYRILGAEPERLRAAAERVLSQVRGFNSTFTRDGGPQVRVDHGPGRPGPGRHVVVVRPLPDGGEPELLRRFADRADEPMPPDRWPLIGIDLYQSGEVTYLTFLASHLAADAYTYYNLRRLATLAYNDPAGDLSDTDLEPTSFPDPAPADPAAIAGFRDNLHAVTKLVPEPLADCRDADGLIRGRRDRVPVAPERAARLARWMDEQGIGRFSFFLGAHALLQSALTGRDDVVVGVPLANRRGRDRRAAFGYFVNTLPIAVDLTAYADFPALCRGLAAQATRMMRHQDFDLAAHTTEVFDNPPTGLGLASTFTYYKESLDLAFDGCRVEQLPLDRRQVMFPLTVNVEDVAGGPWLHVEYADRLAAARPVQLLESILDSVTAGPAVPLTDVRAVGPAEQRRLEALVNDARSYPTAPSIAALVEATAARHPERIAVQDGARTRTYRELDRDANRIAHKLVGAVPGDHVAISVQPGVDLIALLLGVLKAGKCYVPLDPQAPAARLAHIVAQFDALPVVTDPGTFGLAEHPHLIDAAALLDEAAASPGTRDEPPLRRDDPARPAYVIFTSGSTGRPKGVEVTQHNVLRLFASAGDHYDFGPDDTWCLFPSYAFDVSVWEMYGALFHGGRLVIVPERTRRTPEAFADFLADTGVTVLNQTPSAFRQLVGVLTADHAARLAVRYVVFAGESLPFQSVVPWYDLMGERATLVNMYGITETTVHSTYHRLTPASVAGEIRSIIGRPLGDLTIRVVDRYMRACPLGVPGELLVGGAGVANGYLNDPERTAQRFRRDLVDDAVFYRSGDLGYLMPDGTLVYLGRADRQVQLRGFRIELGEVEAALHAVPGVADCAVRLDDRPGIEPRLVAYLVGVAGRPAPTDRELRTALKTMLPAYMIPGYVSRLPVLPLTLNGKIDDAALPLPDIEPPAHPGAKTLATTIDFGGMSAAVAEIWRQVIATDRFGHDDNFFDIGGTSMHVTEIHRRLSLRFEISELKMIDLMEYSTVNELARHIAELKERS